MNNNFLDAVNLAAFVLGIMNYQENLTQNDKSEILQNSQNVSDTIINKINAHLQIRDQKIDFVINKLDNIEKLLESQRN